MALAAGTLALATGALTGCGGSEKPASRDDLTFETLDTLADAPGQSPGRPLDVQFEPYRDQEGALRVRGQINLPDSTRMQVTVRRAQDSRPLMVVQARVVGGAIDTGPVPIGGHIAPNDEYVFEITTQFNDVWQPANVLAATRNGLDLRGPGMRRGLHGEAVFLTTLEKRL